MNRTGTIATTIVRPALRWYRSPIGALAALALLGSIVLALVGQAGIGLAVLTVTVAAVFPYKLQRNEERARAVTQRVKRIQRTQNNADFSTARTAEAVKDLRSEQNASDEKLATLNRQVVSLSKQLQQSAGEVKTLKTELAVLSDRAATSRSIQRKQGRRTEEVYREVQHILSLHRIFAAETALPIFDGWTLGPDAANHFVTTILRDKPKLVVETGSGLSTVLAGLALKKLGSGTVIALEHDSKYFEVTRELIAEHDLEGFATVLYCPLQEHVIAGQAYRWYNKEGLDKSQAIDLLLVDGPPGKTNAQARYPALPELWDMITPATTIIMDDADRQDEQEVIRRWQVEYGPLDVKRLDHERGSVVLKFPNSPADLELQSAPGRQVE